MNTESTDKTILDTNPNASRVIARGKYTFTSLSAFGSLYRATGSVVLNDVLTISNPIIDCYEIYTGVFQKMNFTQSDSSGNLAYATSYYLTSTTANGRDVIQINFEKIAPSSGGSDIYYIVYSSSFSDEAVL